MLRDIETADSQQDIRLSVVSQVTDGPLLLLMGKVSVARSDSLEARVKAQGSSARREAPRVPTSNTLTLPSIPQTDDTKHPNTSATDD